MKEEQERKRADLAQVKMSTPGYQYFEELEAHKWSKFDDETGLPTHDRAGRELTGDELGV